MSLIKSPKQRLPWMNSAFAKSFGIDDLFQDDFFATRQDLPAMNVKEHEDDFEIEFAVPGYSREDFKVSVEDDILYVSADKTFDDIEDEDDYTRREFRYSNFQRMLQLPKSVNLSEEVMANYKDGLLTFRLIKHKDAINSKRKEIHIS